MVDPSGARRRLPAWILYAIGAGFLIFALLNLLRTVAEAPARQRQAALPGVGTVLVTVRLMPDPPKVGPAPFDLELTDARGVGIRADGVVVAVGSTEPGQQEAALRPVAVGSYRGTVQFTAVGEWVLNVEVTVQTATVRVQFPVRVVPNI